MTASRFDRISSAQVKVQHTSSNDPDLISAEVLFEGNGLFSIDMTPQGTLSILFDDIENAEFDLAELLQLISECTKALQAWRENLIKPGEIWEGSV